MKNIAVIYDVSRTTSTGETIGWAYCLRAMALQNYAPDDFSVDIFAYADVPWEGLQKYDLVFNIEYAAPSRKFVPRQVPLVVSFNSDERRRHHFWPPVQNQADFVIFNNTAAFDYYKRPPCSCNISNGIDGELWFSETPVSERPHKLLWCGSSGPTKGKGYAEVFQPLEKLAPEHGFETDFRPINDIDEKIVKPYHEQRAWYNSGSYILCASASEGTPGTSLEGMACGCVLVSVVVGNSREFGKHCENMVFVDRSPESFIQGLLYAREHREQISKAGRETMHNGWTYGPPAERAAYYFQVFRRIIDDGPRSISPFAYSEKHWSEI